MFLCLFLKLKSYSTTQLCGSIYYSLFCTIIAIFEQMILPQSHLCRSGFVHRPENDRENESPAQGKRFYDSYEPKMMLMEFLADVSIWLFLS